MTSTNRAELLRRATQFNAEFEFNVLDLELDKRRRDLDTQAATVVDSDYAPGLTTLTELRSKQLRLLAAQPSEDRQASVKELLNGSNGIAETLLSDEKITATVIDQARRDFRLQLLREIIGEAVEKWLEPYHVIPSVYRSWDPEEREDFELFTRGLELERDSSGRRTGRTDTDVLIYEPIQGPPGEASFLDAKLDYCYHSVKNADLITCKIEIHCPRKNSLGPGPFGGFFFGLTGFSNQGLSREITAGLTAKGEQHWLGTVESFVDFHKAPDRIIFTAWGTVMPKGSYEEIQRDNYSNI